MSSSCEKTIGPSCTATTATTRPTGWNPTREIHGMLVRSVRVSYGGCGDRRTQPCQQGPIMPDLQSLKGRSASFCDLIATSLYRGVLTICNELDCAHTEHADDTPLPVLAPGTGKTRTTRLWTYVRDERPHAGGTVPAVRYQQCQLSRQASARLSGHGSAVCCRPTAKAGSVDPSRTRTGLLHASAYV